MCGIAGYVATSLPRNAQETVRAMTQALARRGPDAEGLHAWPNAVFGHRRLSIFDLSPAGHQPMLSADGEVGVCFNGAVYNFLPIREELERLGHKFKSRSDTEVLVEGYRAWGIDKLVQRCAGMFAFAIWDNPKRTLYLVRDRLGVKPLIYAETRNGIAFASTVEALARAGFAGDIDPQAVLEYLEFGYVTERRSIFAGIEKLPPAHILEWRDGTYSVRQYWTLPTQIDKRMSFEDAVAGTEERLIEAVRLRLEADVPVGALLSGGIDSTLVCWAMAKLNARIESFTIGTPGDPADETPDAVATANLLGIPHRAIPLGDTPPSLDELSEAYGEPFACSSALGMMRVSQAVKPMATVLLTGDGGDDILLGYTEHKNLWLAQRFAGALPSAAAYGWKAVRPLVNLVPPLRRPKHFLDYATGGLGAAARVHDGLPYYESRGLLGSRLRGRDPIWTRNIATSPGRGKRILSDFLSYEYENRFLCEFLQKVDGGTMYHAIEARSPFLDQGLWEFASRIPYDVRLRGGELKAILREIVRRRLGPQVANRPKRGFTIPVGRWLATRWRREMEESLTPDSLISREGWIDATRLPSSVKTSIERQNVPNQLWYLMVFERWLRRLRTAKEEPAPAPAR
jgi:asparagine synthase (glutamine-hydrolysing)